MNSKKMSADREKDTRKSERQREERREEREKKKELRRAEPTVSVQRKVAFAMRKH